MDQFEFWSDLITDYGVICPWASEKYSFTKFPPQVSFSSFNTCRWPELAYYLECLNIFPNTVSSSELPAFEHHKLWCLQTLCWLQGERSLPFGLLVLHVSHSKNVYALVICNHGPSALGNRRDFDFSSSNPLLNPLQCGDSKLIKLCKFFKPVSHRTHGLYGWPSV